MGGLVSRSEGNNRSLDGLRAAMCVWMIVFHSHFWQNYFIPRADMSALGRLPIMRAFVLPGYMAVDVFFVLTGYLLTSSLFRKEKAAREKLAAEAAQPTKGSAAADGDATATGDDGAKPSAKSRVLVPVNVRSWVYRRAMRVLPGILVALAIWCFVLFPKGTFPVSVVRGEPTLRLAKHHFGDATHLPNSCEHAWANLLFINMLIPFGGCMGYTWTLSIQFHFYLVLPLVWNYFGAKGLVRACKWLLVVVVALRAFAPYHMKDVLPMSDELGFFSFFWYSFTITRLAPVLYGVIAAHAVIENKFHEWLRARPALVWSGWALSLVCMWGARALDFESTMSEALQDAPSMAVAALIHPGGVVIGACIAFMMLCIQHSIGAVGSLLHSLFSLRFWAPIAELSFLAYLLHPMVMQKAYATIFAPIQSNGTAFIGYAAFNLVVTLAAALVLHLLVDAPLQALLGRRGGGPPGRAKACAVRCTAYAYYCVLVLSVLAHSFMLYAVITWEATEESYSGLGPNADPDALRNMSG